MSSGKGDSPDDRARVDAEPSDLVHQSAAANCSSSCAKLVLTPPATRSIRDGLPEPVAAAVTEFLTVALVANPHRVGKPLRGDLSGIWAARRGTYRGLYRVNDAAHEVVVLRVEHRRDVHRPH